MEERHVSSRLLVHIYVILLAYSQYVLAGSFKFSPVGQVKRLANFTVILLDYWTF
jgi:hypothetical protein